MASRRASVASIASIVSIASIADIATCGLLTTVPFLSILTALTALKTLDRKRLLRQPVHLSVNSANAVTLGDKKTALTFATGRPPL